MQPVCRGSSYTQLQLIPAEFYNIIFIAFHLNVIGEYLKAYRTLHHIASATIGQGCAHTSSICAMPA